MYFVYLQECHAWKPGGDLGLDLIGQPGSRTPAALWWELYHYHLLCHAAHPTATEISQFSIWVTYSSIWVTVLDCLR